MPVTSYYSVNNVLLGEKPAGSARLDYLSDALGSVTATIDSTGQKVNSYRYKPYGGQLAKSGTGSDPAFTWVGKWGYRQTRNRFSDVYVRARHYSSSAGRWTTKDPIGYADGWNVLGYSRGNPILQVDPHGLAC